MRHATRGTSIVEALVGTALAGIALAGLAGTATLASGSLRLARDTGSALALATTKIETLRAGPRLDGGDGWGAPDGTTFTRTWTVTGGRGRPVVLSSRVVWRGRALALRTEAWP